MDSKQIVSSDKKHNDKKTKGFLLYVVGISGSGKSTISYKLEEYINAIGNRPLQVIDGDIIRKQFGDLFGYTYEERMKCNRAVRVVVQYLVNNGVNVILTQVAAYKEMRDVVREQFKDKYALVYVKCSAEECRKRDVKGYYSQGIDNLNGVTDVYEEPDDYDIVVNTEKQTVEESAHEILDYLGEVDFEL